jgi:UDP-N-acetylglucosamine/UDP-N-acetylgalactosamine diphosphorylase
MQAVAGAFRLITCNSVTPPTWMDPPSPMDWKQMEQALEQHGQAHVLTPPPPPERRDAFLAQLKTVDLAGIPSMLKTSLAGAAERTKKLEPFPDVVTLSELPTAEQAALRSSGLDMIAKGEVAALLLAGGQGTRLGTSAPKGCYDIGLPSGKSLFAYHCERLLKARRLAAAHAKVDPSSVRLRLIVMTSSATDAETKAFFHRHAFFGLGESQVIFFEQGMLPCLTEEGKLLLEQPGELSMAPNGNGGVYVSLRDSGVLSQLEREGVKSVFQFGVDNVLCHVAEPIFLGFCRLRSADCAAKTVPKREPHEAVGVVALSDGAPAVVEYSEISKEMAEATDANGQLLFGASHICVNYFSLAFLREFCEKRLHTLPLHVARKKIPHVAPDGTRVTPSSNNGVKLEYFIFDTFPLAKRMAALQVPREEEFAPVKNPPGAKSDSPDTARQMIYKLSRARLEAAGGSLRQPLGQVPLATSGSAEEAPPVEISPLLSYQGEGLEETVRGNAFEAPVLLSAPDEGDARK